MSEGEEGISMVFHKSQGRQIGWDSGGGSGKIARKEVRRNLQDWWYR